jgi:hypothetical protein
MLVRASAAITELQTQIDALRRLSQNVAIEAVPYAAPGSALYQALVLFMGENWVRRHAESDAETSDPDCTLPSS